MSRVPTTATVVRGASVNIVLKADQPTGRTVSGTVQDILTRGNHPRGIKQSGAPAAQDVVDVDGAPGPAAFGDRPPRRRQGRRQEQEAELPSSQVGLEAYIRPAKQKNGGRGRVATGAGGVGEDSTLNVPSEVVTCPVCGAFEGDASAVEHHVASHFD
ncbi:MFS multidrug transporter [Colletotrichum karsti]|uniref:MFS multidrug transporter n=1 Tax=Colletotrichum karsti TaxID=1095194 RepID=A0A9P6I368_9PEZI|nr:MFS multidrug transporter [Colletotrichum karsti]KAF9873141.1 MFS multidrug transporter [Colletotrichum karsti]